MTPPRHPSAHRARKPNELQQSIESRTKKKVVGSERFDVTTPRQLDRNAIFRFMDLPPELRVMVYRELLPIEHIAHRPCDFHTGILTVSKDIHREAEGVLYATEPLPLFLSVKANQTFSDRENVRATFRIACRKPSSAFASSLGVRPYGPRPHKDWPCGVHNFRRIVLKINLGFSSHSGSPSPSGVLTDRMFHQLNHRLYHLVGFFPAVGAIDGQELQVHIDATAVPSFAAKAALALGPLAKLGDLAHGVKLTLHGVPARTAQELAARSSQWQDTQNTFRIPQCRKKLDAAKELLQVALEVDRAGAEFKNLEARFFQMEENMSFEGYVDAYRDRFIMESVVELDKVVKVVHGELQTTVREKLQRLDDLDQLLDRWKYDASGTTRRNLVWKEWRRPT